MEEEEDAAAAETARGKGWSVLKDDFMGEGRKKARSWEAQGGSSEEESDSEGDVVFDDSDEEGEEEEEMEYE